MTESKISRMLRDKWCHNQVLEESVARPFWSEVRNAILELDGNSRTLLTLYSDNDQSMMIGGGAANKCVVFVGNEKDGYLSIFRPDGTNESVLIMVGGQQGDYRDSNVVDREGAIVAAKYFFENGAGGGANSWVPA